MAHIYLLECLTYSNEVVFKIGESVNPIERIQTWKNQFKIPVELLTKERPTRGQIIRRILSSKIHNLGSKKQAQIIEHALHNNFRARQTPIFYHEKGRSHLRVSKEFFVD